MKRVLISGVLVLAVLAWIFLAYSSISPWQKDNNGDTPSGRAIPFDRGKTADIDDCSPHPMSSAHEKDGIIYAEGLNVGDAPAGYIESSLMIGDSRFVGLQSYGGADLKDATWFAATSMGVYNYEKSSVDVPGLGKITLKELLAAKQFRSIYVCLGINQIGYGMQAHEAKFDDFIKMLRQAQPGAKIILVSNLHVAAERSDKDKSCNNDRINELNSYLKGLQDSTSIFYIECNQLFDDASGAMRKDYTSDNTHLYAKHYPAWSAYIKSHAIY